MYTLQFGAINASVMHMADVAALAPADAETLLRLSIVKLSALRASLNYDRMTETFRRNDLADSYTCTMATIRERSPQMYTVAHRWAHTRPRKPATGS